MVLGSHWWKCTIKQALTCRLSPFVRRHLLKIKVIHPCTFRRNLDILVALIQILKCPTSGPNLTRGRILMIAQRVIPTQLVPRSRCRLYGVRTLGTRWIWMYQLKSGNLTPPHTNNNVTYLLSYSNKCRPRLNRRISK